MRVVVTGLGMVSSLGTGVEHNWKSVLEGKNGIRTVEHFDPEGLPVTFGAAVPEWLRSQQEEASLKLTLTKLAVKEALEQAGIKDTSEFGTSVGSEAERPPIDELAIRLRDKQLMKFHEMLDGGPWVPADYISRVFGAKGPKITVSTACTSSAQAIGEAMLRIRRGEFDGAIAGGVDVLVDPLMLTGFSLLSALSSRNDEPEKACRPFDRDRDGFILADGAGFVILESYEHAKNRGAKILGEILGYGTSLNAWRITDSPPDGRGAAQSMKAALKDANLTVDDIDYINAHGTSTPQNDISEATAIRNVFGFKPLVSSTKSMTGHTVAACGAIEFIFSLLACRDGIAPHTRNLENVEPGCELNHVMNAPKPAKIRNALTNAFGFGGSNGTLIVRASW